MGIMSEGIKLLIVGLIGILVSIFLIIYSRWVGIPLLLLFLMFSIFSLYFFRDPVRDKIFTDDQIIAPGDGKIISIKEERKDILTIRIFLSIFDVHIQRSPISGNIKKIEFIQGKFAIAYKPQAKDNQRNIIMIEGENGRFAEVEQITGAIARRIACYVKEGDRVQTGQKIGMIYFGSQVALHIPKNVKLLVKEGENVLAGETIIALW